MTNNSRLKEIDFSGFNLRDAYISKQADYISELRDEALFSNWGVKVLVRVPSIDNENLNENNVDEYSNFVDVDWLDSTEIVIPKFKEYRQNIADYGMTADGIDGLYPLEVLIPSKLHLPRNSRLIFNEYNSKNEKVSREWVVLSTQVKQLSDSKTYSRIAQCVPARQNTYSTAQNLLAEAFFSYDLGFLHKTKNVLFRGEFWFDYEKISNDYFTKYFIIEDETGQEKVPVEINNIKELNPKEVDSIFSSRYIMASVLN